MGLIDQIKEFEGYREQPYWDQKQYTSGYGTKANAPDERIDQATAEQRLQTAIAAAAAHVDSVNPNLPQGARDALISLTYNAGPGWAKAGLGDLVRAGDLEGARARLLQYNKAGWEVNPALVKRRAAEAAWFDGQPAQQGPLQPAPVSPVSPAQAIPQGSPPIFPQQQPAPQQATPDPRGYFAQMPAEQFGQPPPIFTPPRKPIDLRALRAALARSQAGFFNAPR